MLRRLEVSERDIRNHAIEVEYRHQQLIEDEAARREREMVNAAMQRDQTKVKQLFDRIRRLDARRPPQPGGTGRGPGK